MIEMTHTEIIAALDGLDMRPKNDVLNYWRDQRERCKHTGCCEHRGETYTLGNGQVVCAHTGEVCHRDIKQEREDGIDS